MRRVLPLWSSLLAVLLLSQWIGAASACLPGLQAPAMVLCHAGDGAPPPVPGQGDVHGGMACPLCAPLPPFVLAGPAGAPASAATGFVLAVVALPAAAAPAAPFVSPQQPRAPPVSA